MTDLLVKNCMLANNKDPKDILIEGGIIKDISTEIIVDQIPVIDADFHFVTPPFVDSHPYNIPSRAIPTGLRQQIGSPSVPFSKIAQFARLNHERDQQCSGQ